MTVTMPPSGHLLDADSIAVVIWSFTVLASRFWPAATVGCALPGEINLGSTLEHVNHSPCRNILGDNGHPCSRDILPLLAVDPVVTLQ
jgi:hypothetical protein